MSVEKTPDHLSKEQDLATFDTDLASFKEAQVTVVTEDEETPTEEEMATLRHISDSVTWVAIVLAFAEFAERASYYGCQGLFTNFVQRPLPKGGNGAGAVPAGSEQSAGALGLGLTTATAVLQSFNFLSFTIPILGGLVADVKLGRFKTICLGVGIGVIGHILLVIAALPTVIRSGHALAPFEISILIITLATGLIKANVAPLVLEQARPTRIRTLKSGERVILDKTLTLQSSMMIYYWSIYVGALLKLGTTYAEKRIGFWLGFLVPTIAFVLMIPCMAIIAKPVVVQPPTGSAVFDGFKVFGVIIKKGGLKGMLKGGDAFWNHGKPSVMAVEGTLEGKKAGWLNWDDEFVDDLRKTFSACKIFLFLPIFNLSDGGIWSLFVSMAGSMTSDGVPNDLLTALNPITIIVFSPILQFLLYPTLNRMGIHYPRVWRIVTGFLICTFGQIIGAIIQWRVYETSPCGWHATTCKTGVSPMSLWWVVPLYVLPSLAELFINVECYQLAIQVAPPRMKSVVFGILLFMTALSSAIILIISPSFKDPHLIRPFIGVACASFVSAILIAVFFRKADIENKAR
ncbi:hypothetical protein A1O3_04764 [Capronia epimyces CBS 606.96]|uniref:POT family proton-dependent oligopeptide transporter n=1 Tax=Capronia epimyces CBS 606.96 TaxID=1182542 RepID=W9XU56_9EURO|nr:uncharacterized protein A1O3_04764 [Capronia epimyces CBS 606.96]EXJ84097.1 hypothetical protein A1O3_04764 [Capronia epimyces CBS 606.96]